ncbi:hypothetical protein WJX84_002014 [Apatococcus fuscideae]|uniref:Uncharacterized protein n=1 Tax=Apatococcus fuscideae TaxID=2026836 RepID=A0AAW1TIS9_9CHLO
MVRQADLPLVSSAAAAGDRSQVSAEQQPPGRTVKNPSLPALHPTHAFTSRTRGSRAAEHVQAGGHLAAPKASPHDTRAVPHVDPLRDSSSPAPQAEEFLQFSDLPSDVPSQAKDSIPVAELDPEPSWIPGEEDPAEADPGSPGSDWIPSVFGSPPSKQDVPPQKGLRSGPAHDEARPSQLARMAAAVFPSGTSPEEHEATLLDVPGEEDESIEGVEKDMEPDEDYEPEVEYPSPASSESGFEEEAHPTLRPKGQYWPSMTRQSTNWRRSAHHHGSMRGAQKRQACGEEVASTAGPAWKSLEASDIQPADPPAGRKGMDAPHWKASSMIVPEHYIFWAPLRSLGEEIGFYTGEQLRYLGVQKGLHPQQGAYTVVLIFAERYPLAFYDDPIQAARAYDRAAIAIMGPERALTSFNQAAYVPEDLVQRKGGDLLRFLSQIQTERGPQMPLRGQAPRCGKCLACLQPFLYTVCRGKKIDRKAVGLPGPEHFMKAPQAPGSAGPNLSGAEMCSQAPRIRLMERYAAVHAAQAAHRAGDKEIKRTVHNIKRQALEVVLRTRCRTLEDYAREGISYHPFSPEWKQDPAVNPEDEKREITHFSENQQEALEELHQLLRCFARGERVEVDYAQESQPHTPGCCVCCTSMHHPPESSTQCPIYWMQTTDHSLDGSFRAKGSSREQRALQAFPGWCSLAQSLHDAPTAEILATIYQRLSSDPQKRQAPRAAQPSRGAASEDAARRMPDGDKGRLRPALAQVMHALQAYAGVLADDKGIKATRKLMPADLLATGLLLEQKLKQKLHLETREVVNDGTSQ